MSKTDVTKNNNWGFIIGVLVMSVGMQFANYGTVVCVAGAVSAMNASQYYVLIAAMGTLGIFLRRPPVNVVLPPDFAIA